MTITAGKKWFGVVMGLLFLGLLFPLAASADAAGVYYGGALLQEGVNEIGGGTATLDSAAATLTLEGVALDKELTVVRDEGNEFTLIFKGTNTMGTQEAPIGMQNAPGGAIQTSSGTTMDLNVQIEEGASLTTYTYNSSAINVVYGDLNLSGKGTLTAIMPDSATTSHYTLEAGVGDVNISDLTVKIDTGNIGIYAGYGIQLVNAELDIDAELYGAYAYDATFSMAGGKATITANDDGIQSYRTASVTDSADVTIEAKKSGIRVVNGALELKDSTLNVTSDSDAAIRCQYNPLTVDNAKVTVASGSSYDVLTIEGNIVIQGEDTVIQGSGMGGIYSVKGKTQISGGQITMNVNQFAVQGDSGVEITGGTLALTVENYADIFAKSGPITITGENTRVTAVTENADVYNPVATQNGVITIDAFVSVDGGADCYPFMAVVQGKAEAAILLGEGCEPLENVQVLNQDNSGVVLGCFAWKDSGELVTGKLELCHHRWQQPTFQWSEDCKSCQATFVCMVEQTHVAQIASTDPEGTLTARQITQPTCTDNGVTQYTFTVTAPDGQTYTDQRSMANIPATGHKYETYNPKGATCTEDGYTGDSACKYCGDPGRTGTVIPAFGHTYQDGKCVRCGAADPSYRTGYTTQTSSKPSSQQSGQGTASGNQEAQQPTAAPTETPEATPSATPAATPTATPAPTGQPAQTQSGGFPWIPVVLLVAALLIFFIILFLKRKKDEEEEYQA